MNKIKIVGKQLTKADQKKILGGTGSGTSTVFCKKADPNSQSCDVIIQGACPSGGASLKAICEADATCKEFNHSFGCQADGSM